MKPLVPDSVFSTHIALGDIKNISSIPGIKYTVQRRSIAAFNLNNITDNLHRDLILANQRSDDFYRGCSGHLNESCVKAMILLDRFKKDVRFLKPKTIISSNSVALEIDCISDSFEGPFIHYTMKIYSE